MESMGGVTTNDGEGEVVVTDMLAPWCAKQPRVAGLVSSSTKVVYICCHII